MITSTSIEEFNFPVIMSNNPLANLVLSSSSSSLGSNSFSSSSLWRVNSSRVFHHHHHEEHKATEEDDLLEVQSMCEGFVPIHRRHRVDRLSFQGGELEMEEKMDYLWEDFNEEVEREDVREVRRGNEVCILQGTKMGRRPTSTSSGMLAIGKLFKGLLSFRRKPSHPKVVSQRW